MSLKRVRRLAYDYFFICIGLAFFAFGWTAFLTPNQMTGGGVTGLAAIIYFATSSIPMGVTIFAVNAILIAIAWRVLGPKFCINTLICTIILSFFMGVGQKIFVQPLVDDLFMCAMIGAALSAFGVGIAISFGGNTGGTDIIALMVGKYRNISYGRVSLYSNILVVASSYLIVHSVEKLVYSMVVMFVYIFVSDIVIDGYKQTFQFMVFSKKNHEIADKILNEVGRGATFLKAYGSFSKNESDVLLIISHRNDKANIMRVIKEIDNEAFVSIAKTSSVFGKNFDNIKI
ncbi:MAG: YitT family protein [Bacteroidetes bacterium]|nr:YitT family protein [Bacteroidota bacterium]MCL2303658.1 YitT family protein [Lentimicrobiaceae bacterium]